MTSNTRSTAIDVVIICTRRYTLLQRTIESFSEYVFPFFELNKAIINIDPIWGDESDHQETVAVARRHFKKVSLLEPDAPGFCAAVQRTWEQTSADIVLHLEEDWLALQPVVPNDVTTRLNDTVKQLSLMCSNKKWNGVQKYHYKRYRPWFLPFKIEDKSKPCFSTSPGFWDGQFLRHCASLLDTQLDPEKQFYNAVNAPLEAFVQGSKCQFLFGEKEPNLIEDIGREWRMQRNIRKEIVNHQSVWSDYG